MLFLNQYFHDYPNLYFSIIKIEELLKASKQTEAIQLINVVKDELYQMQHDYDHRIKLSNHDITLFLKSLQDPKKYYDNLRELLESIRFFEVIKSLNALKSNVVSKDGLYSIIPKTSGVPTKKHNHISDAFIEYIHKNNELFYHLNYYIHRNINKDVLWKGQINSFYYNYNEDKLIIEFIEESGIKNKIKLYTVEYSPYVHIEISKNIDDFIKEMVINTFESLSLFKKIDVLPRSHNNTSEFETYILLVDEIDCNDKECLNKIKDIQYKITDLQNAIESKTKDLDNLNSKLKRYVDLINRLKNSLDLH